MIATACIFFFVFLIERCRYGSPIFIIWQVFFSLINFLLKFGAKTGSMFLEPLTHIRAWGAKKYCKGYQFHTSIETKPCKTQRLRKPGLPKCCKGYIFHRTVKTKPCKTQRFRKPGAPKCCRGYNFQGPVKTNPCKTQRF